MAALLVKALHLTATGKSRSRTSRSATRSRPPSTDSRRPGWRSPVRRAASVRTARSPGPRPPAFLAKVMARTDGHPAAPAARQPGWRRHDPAGSAARGHDAPGPRRRDGHAGELHRRGRRGSRRAGRHHHVRLRPEPGDDHDDRDRQGLQRPARRRDRRRRPRHARRPGRPPDPVHEHVRPGAGLDDVVTARTRTTRR